MLDSLQGASAPTPTTSRQPILSRQQCIIHHRHCTAGHVKNRRGSLVSPCSRTSTAAVPLRHRSAAFLRCSTGAGRSDDQENTQSAAPAEQRWQQSACTAPAPAETGTGVLSLQTQRLWQQDQQRQPPWLPAPPSWQAPSAATLRTALYIVIGSLLAWRYTASRLAAGGTSFAALSLGSSFHTASQTGPHRRAHAQAWP